MMRIINIHLMGRVKQRINAETVIKSSNILGASNREFE